MDEDEWYDLSSTIPINAFNVTPLLTMDSEGAGRAVLVSLRDQRNDELMMLMMSPALAGQLGWEMTGVANNYAEMFEDDPRETDDQ